MKKSIALGFLTLIALVVPFSASADITTGLQGWWKLDEGAGTSAADSSGNNFNGTLTNGPVPVTGKIGSGSLNFDGSNDKVLLPASVDVSTVPFTLSAWINPTNYGNWRQIFSKRDSWSSSGMRWQWDLAPTSGRVRLLRNGGPTNVTFTYAPPLNVWTHLSVVARSGGTDLYVNGVLNQSFATTFSLGTGAGASAAIGGLGGENGENFFGTIDDVRLYSRALSTSDIQELYAYTGNTDPLSAPSISAQPLSQAVNAGQTASFTVAASGNPSPAYQWQKMPQGGSFADIPSATSATYTTPSLTTSNSGETYRVIVSNSQGQVTSNSVTLTVTSAPTYIVTISKTGTGAGTVSGQGISCGTDCTETLTAGVSLTLTATPAQGSAFQGWTGGGCSGTGSCTVSAAATVTAGFSASSGGTVRNAASCNYDAVLAEYNLANAGDTIQVPSGTCTWSNTLTVAKPVNIIGAGRDLTRILNSQTDVHAPLIRFNPTSDQPIRVSGFYFKDDGTRHTSAGLQFGRGPVHLTQARVDNNTFENFRFAFLIYSTFGVAHDNYFLNNRQNWQIQGYLNSSYLYGISPPPWPWNSTNYWVWEDNKFEWTALDYITYLGDTEYPAPYIFRHNRIDVNRLTGMGADGIDMHGETDDLQIRRVGVQVYNNNWYITGDKQYNPMRILGIRGGEGSLVYGNRVYGLKAETRFTDNPYHSPLMSNTYTWDNYYDEFQNGNSLPMFLTFADGVTENVHVFNYKPSNFAELAYPHPLRGSPSTYTLTVSKSGTGSGTVSSNVGGITNCSTSCTTTALNSGTSITLTASPATNTTVSWNGCTPSGNTCTVTLNANTNVTAMFSPVPAGSGIDCDQGIVQTAIDNARDGDVITCKAGSWTWVGSPALTINNKHLTLQGAGHGCSNTFTPFGHAPASCTGTATSITFQNTENYSVGIQVYDDTKPFRITGFRFNRASEGGTATIFINKHAAYLSDKNATPWRIDNNHFNGTARHIYVIGARNFGLIDNNIFYVPGGHQVILMRGSGTGEPLGNIVIEGSSAHSDPVNLGSADAVYVENNEYFTNVWHGRQEVFDGTAGMRQVIRNNVIRGNILGSHGVCSGGRGTYTWEIYENDIYPYNWNGSSGSQYGGVGKNGGTGVIHNNRFYGGWHNAVGEIEIRNQRSSSGTDSACVVPANQLCDGSSSIDTNSIPGRTGPLCLDQVGAGQGPAGSQQAYPAYVWGNVNKGSGSANTVVSPGISMFPGQTTTPIQLNRDVFNAVKPGYTAFTYPYPLDANGFPNPGGSNPPPPPSTYTLTVTKSGTGSGTVTSSGGSINCGSTCSVSGVTPGTVSTLTATPAAGSVFAGWSGGGCSGTGSCTITINSNVTVTATFNTSSGGTVRNAASCNYDAVLAEYNLANAGDTIQVPSGTCTWSNTLTVAKPVNIIGAGWNTSSPTRLVANTLSSGFFFISGNITSPVRVSGFYFDLVAHTTSPKYAINTAGSITQLRVDNNRFDYGKYALNLNGRLKGVVDHNYFYNNDASIQVIGGIGDDNGAWSNPIVAGMDMGLNTLYIETNDFILDNNVTVQTNNRIESGQGGNFVIRYNNFDATQYRRDGFYTFYPIMLHGNGGYYNYSTPSLSLRGHPIVETYGNTIRAYRVDDPIYFRGGSNIVFDNTVYYEYGTSAGITLREEEATGDAGGGFQPRRTQWPAEDQIFNSFIWNNKMCRGTGCTPALITQPSFTAGSSVFIQEGRDYFIHPPEATGGKEVFTGRPGSSNTYPTQFSPDTMVFQSSGANAYYPYTPFTYPHPLVTGATPPPTTYTLSVSKSGAGSGTITSSGGSINCGSACSVSGVTPGTVSTLTATPAAGSVFAGWSGGGCSGTGTCTITINSDITVTATFNTSSGGTVRSAASCSLTDIRNEINLAVHGDIVRVPASPAGGCTWAGTLVINKAIQLIGAGIGNTVINNGGVPYIITIERPANNDQSASRQLTRVSGFTFNINNAQAIFLDNNPTHFKPPVEGTLDPLRFPPYSKLRIDNNRFINSTQPGAAIYNAGMYGVIDHNIFDGLQYPLRIGDGDIWSGGKSNWINLPELQYGALEDNIWVEDNIFNMPGFWPITDADQGGRWAMRYNTINMTQGQHYPFSDIHGGRGTLWSAMGAEMYGNYFLGAETGGSTMNAYRGGRFLAFYNSTREDGSNWLLYNNTGCPVPPYPERQLQNNGLYFGNRIDNNGPLMGTTVTVQSCGTINHGDEYIDDRAVSMGNSLPAACTVGTAFWLTNQSTTDLTGLVGDERTFPNRGVIRGTLYRCFSTNVWTKYFEPMVYPHPLVSGDSNPPPPPPTDVAPPSVSITAPSGGTIVTGTIAVSANATDDVGVVGVQFRLDGANLGAEDTSAPYSVQWDSATAVNGGHSITATARDASGKLTTSAVVSVTVSNITGGGTVINTASCSQTDVKNAIALAKDGDTVNVPAGTCIWTAPTVRVDNGVNKADQQPAVTINKAIYFMGAGIDKTIIRGSGTMPDGFLLYYSPSDYSKNSVARISGFTFDANQGGGIGIGTGGLATATLNAKLRFDHNKIINNGVTDNTGSYAILNYSTVFGVLDSNIIEARATVGSYQPPNGVIFWNTFNFNYGDVNSNIYFEDNIIDTGMYGYRASNVSNCSRAGRYVFRYNTITLHANGSPLWDMHGNQGGTIKSCFGAELYGNHITQGTYGMNLVQVRGGKALVFNNYSSFQYNPLDVITQVTEEYPDEWDVTTNIQPQHVSDTYFWNNRAGKPSAPSVGDPLMPTYIVNKIGSIPTEDVHFWKQKATAFDGTTGVGCGTLASRPATCSNGVGYWATNQSCSSIDSSTVGKDATPISGTLYKCSAPNTWTAYYTPLAYPHPLRTDCVNYPKLCDEGSTPPPPPTGTYAVIITKAGAGQAGSSVGSSPSGINCGITCSASFNNGTTVTLTATPASGYQTAWSGCASSSGNICTVTGASTVTATFNVTVTPPTIPLMPSLAFEAEAGLIESPFTKSGTVISQSSQTVDPAQGGKASYRFTVPESGNYIIKMLVNAPNTGADSLFINIDSEPTSPSMVWDITPTTSGVQERTVSWRGSGTTVSEFDPKIFNLNSGEHTLIVRGREAGVQIDRITIEVLPGADTTPPSQPTNLTASVSGNVVTLNWTGSTDDRAGTVGYRIIKNGVLLKTVNTLSTTDTDAPGTYSYQVIAIDSALNASTPSNTATATILPPADTIPPATIVVSLSNPQQTAVTLSWTAVGDDGLIGTASAYEARYSLTAPGTDLPAWWASATPFTGLPTPRAPGTTETYTAVGLSPNLRYYIAVRAVDDNQNRSPLTTQAIPSIQTLSVISTYTLTITPQGTGQGTVTGVAGTQTVLSCGTDCTETVNAGTQITLTAVPSQGSTFGGFSGGGGCSTSPCTVTVNGNTSLSATFSRILIPPTVAITSPLSGATSTVGTPITISLSASDDRGVTDIILRDGTTILTTLTTPPYTYIWQNPPQGLHTLTATARDADSQTTVSASVAITVLSVSTTQDSDGDGIADSLDRCPNTYTLARPYVNGIGCPKPKASKFSIVSNFDTLDLLAATTIEIGDSNGKITYSHPSGTSFIYIRPDNTNDRLDLDQYLSFEPKKVTADSTYLPFLKEAATTTITLYNVTVNTPRILKDGQPCNTCENVSYQSGTLSFTVQGFSTYEVTEGYVPPQPPVQQPGGGGGGGGISYAADTIPPQNPSTFTATAGDHEVRLSWTNPTDFDFIRVRIYRATSSIPDLGYGVVIYEGRDETHTDTKLQNDTRYGYRITAFDALPNYSSGVTAEATPSERALFGYGTLPGLPCLPTPATRAAVFTKNLLLGDRGEDVKQLQILLNEKGFLIAASGPGSRGQETTFFGPATMRALIKFQEAYKAEILTPSGLQKGTGYFGNSTRAKVNALRGGIATSTIPCVQPPAQQVSRTIFTRNLSIGMRGEDVKALQMLLNAQGFLIAATGPGSKGQETTLFGPATQRAVIQYQTRHNIFPRSGIVGPLTRAKLEGR